MTVAWMKGLIMRTGTTARRSRIFQSLAPDRRALVKQLKAKVNDPSWLLELEGKLGLVADDLIDEAAKLRH